MKHNLLNSYCLLVIFLTLTLPLMSWAGVATCKIEIEDINKETIYLVEQKFTFKNGGNAQRKHFEIPGNDYTCTLAFFDLDSGTMLSCGYKKDLGNTFFQSDRSTLSEKSVVNNLSFRHESAFIYIQTRCQ